MTMQNIPPPARPRTVLWWGKFDPEYSRNRILRQCFERLGWHCVDMRPIVSILGDWQAHWSMPTLPDLVFVPCFRQRDIAAASRWARQHGIPLMIDPLISAYDKQVFERGKFTPDSRAAHRLLNWERKLLRRAQVILTDTPAHAEFFQQTFDIAPDRLAVVHVGADETLFKPEPHIPNNPLDVLFFGSFISLQGPEVIIEAACRYQGPPVNWSLVGTGPLLTHCRTLARNHPDIRFEPWLPGAALAKRIQHADIVLGIFGTSAKAGRVIPNKVYQALACGKPVITRESAAYPAELIDSAEFGIRWVPPGDSETLALTIAGLAAEPRLLEEIGLAARMIYELHFSAANISAELRSSLKLTE